jgi:hypothetical protein
MTNLEKRRPRAVTHRNKNLQFIYTLAIGVVLLLSSSRAFATNEQNHIQEIMAGANGNSKIQFIVIKQEGGGNLWGPQAGETQSRAMLVFFDGAGRLTGKFKFPHDVPADANPQLIATQDFANLPGAPVPDFIMPPLLSPIGGQVCFTNNPLNPNAAPRTDCVSYGTFPPAQVGNDSGGCNGTIPAGSPTVALPIVNTASLTRTSTACGSVASGDFVINNTPTPVNDAGQTFTIGLASQVDQGGNLFNGETFQGNGRTCATCHVASLNMALPPSNIQSRFRTVSTTFDPLFIGETAPSSFDAGFDFNLNTLELTQEISSSTPCLGTLQGVITSGSGATAARAKVLTQVSPTTYLVYGGMNPALSGTVSDSSSCSGTVASITAGSLGATSSVLGLEDPKRMRTSKDTVNFPQGRGLILENIDGFANPNVFRKSPHLLNLSQRFFSGFGLSGNFGNLQSFATGAVQQHFPRTLARNSGGTNPDFRLPTPDELADMEAFMRSLDFPAGNNPNKFNLNNFVVTAAQQRGRDAFFGAAKCAECHGGTVLNSGCCDTISTGVVNQTINSAAVDNLPCEPNTPCGTRAFVVRQLFNIANLGPFFHDGSAATLREVLALYNSSNFANSQGGFAVGPINTAAISPTATDDIIAFLEGISFSPFSPIFGPTGTSVTITGFTGATAVSFNGVSAAFTVDASGTITTTVPAGATTGPVTITTPGGPLVTTTRFTVTPVVSSFAPANGPVGTGVTITGTNFTGATAVSFNGTLATTFTVNSSGTVTATVPFGTASGPITVKTLDGVATSVTSFTVTPGGPPFGLGAAPSTQTIGAGSFANYTVIISRSAGFADNLNFSVTGLPAATTATFSPNPATTAGNSSAMTVTTTARSAQLAPWQTLWAPPANFGVRAWPLWAICLLVMVLLAYRYRARRQIPRWVFATGAITVLLFVGCGGGGSGPPPPPPGTPAGTFTLTVTATSSNSSVQPVSMPVTLIVK